MKKAFSLLLIFLLIFTIGCSKSSDVIFDTSGLSFSALYEDNEFKVEIIEKTVKIEDNNHIKYIFNNSSLTLENGGLSYSLGYTSLPENNIPLKIFKCFNTFNNKTINKHKNEYLIEDKNYILYLTASGLPQKIMLKSEKKEIIITKLKIIT